MQSTTKIAAKLKRYFAGYQFVAGDAFGWSPTQHQISHPHLATSADIWTLLHEIAHAELSHYSYLLDVELIRQEAAAWEYAQTVLAPRFKQEIQEDHIQDHLDTYRVWLHERSRCPECDQNGLQTTQNTYSCSNCRCLWRVNDARGCALRRIRLQALGRSS
jgi:hypothetical protein